MRRGSEVRADVLSGLVQRKIAEKGNLREAAIDAEVSAATLSRVQRGHIPDTDTLAALARWLQVPIEKLLYDPPSVDVPRDEMTTMQKVEVHLRADPDLSPETAIRIAEVWRGIYEQFRAHDVGRAQA
jgi:transcriptional regulator with XRE-family HTH domain